MYREHRVAVVMPIHDEEDHLEGAIARVPAFVDWLIAVDDGSRDGTWARLATIADRRLIKLRHEKNLGVGAATKTGYRHSLRTGAELIAVMDGDGQMDGRDLPGLLDAAIAGGDYVKGNRFLDSTTIACMPRARFLGNRIFSWLTRRAAAFAPGLDAQCGYTVIRRSALQALDLQRLYDRYGFPNEIFFAACGAGLTVTSVPVRTLYGDETSGINPFTAVPMIACLIARSYLRRVFSPRPSAALLKLTEIDPGSTE